MTTFWQDLRFAFRVLAKSPGFTAVAVLTLALGIGANTAIFSVVRGVLLHGLPFPNASRLVQVQESVAKDQPNPVSYPNFLDWKAQNHVFQEMAAYSDAEYIISGGDSSERIFGETATDTYFDLLGVQASLGRTFLPEENKTPGQHAVAVIGYGLWQRRFGSDPNILGKTIRLNGAPFIVVGVTPRGFRGFSDEAEAWIPIMMRDATWPEVAKFDFIHNRDVHWLRTLGLLQPNISMDTARLDLATIASSLEKAYPKENRQRGILLRPASEHFVAGFRKPLLVLLAAVGLVLLIACANVTNLLLTRTIARNREFAVRLSLGASRARILQQLVTESLLLSLLGAAAGIALAAWGREALVRLLPIALPSFAAIRLDTTVLLYACALTFATGLLLGALPALGNTRMDLTSSLKEGSKASAGKRGRKLGAVLVVSEVALSLVLLIGAGLLLKTLANMLTSDPGFRSDHLVTMRFYVPDHPSNGADRNRFGPDLAQAISAVPGVDSAAVTFIDPFLWSGFSRGYSIEGHPALTPAEIDEIYYQEIGPGFFRTMGIPLKAGREFTFHDTSEAPRRLIVNETFVRRYWPGQDPIGKRVKYGTLDSENPWMEVVGVAGNFKFESVRQDAAATPVVYGGLLQSEVIINMSLIVRTHVDPAAMIKTLREAIRKFNPQVPVYNMATVEDRMRESAAETRSYALLLAIFALVALTLAVVGIFGVMSYWVSQRTQEIGIRRALGAGTKQVLQLVLRDGFGLLSAGIGAGLLAALLVTRAMQSMLFGVQPTDALTFVGAAGLFLAVGALACYLPARRASRVDPMVALRYE